MDIITYALLKKQMAALSTKYGSLAEGFSYKGSVASTAALPATDNTAGDLYTVTGEGNARYLYDGEEWVNLDSDITDIKNAISQKQDAPSSAGTAGQVLGLDSNLDPVWVNQSGSGDTSNCAPVIINTASGDIASFADGADNRQIRKIVGTIVPQQSGTGDPSPDNVRPISGGTGCNINQIQENLFEVSNIKASENLQFTSGAARYTTVSDRAFVCWNCNLHVGYGGTYTGISFQEDVYSPKVLKWTMTVPDNLGDNLYLHIGHSAGQSNRDGMFWYPISPGTYYFTANILAANPNIANGFSFNKIVISDTDFTTLPINWQTEAGTIYGGTITLYENESVDVVSDKAYALLNNPDLWAELSSAATTPFQYQYDFNDRKLYNNSYTGLICSYYKVNSNDQNNTARWTSASARNFGFKSPTLTLEQIRADAAAGKIAICYDLATPQTYHFDNIGALYTYLGTNNVWIDTGAITECDYPADTKLYIDGLTAPDEDMIANANIASGKYFVVNNQLYLSTAAIAAGASIVPGTNCTATSLAEALNALNT